MKLIAKEAGNTWTMGRFSLKIAVFSALGVLGGLGALDALSAATTVAAPVPAPALQAFSTAAEGVPPPPWRVVGLPDRKIALTEFQTVALDGSTVLRLRASKSYGTLGHALPRHVPGPQATLQWRWRLEQPLTSPNLRRKDGDDAALKVCAMFDMPLERLGFVERNLIRLARTRSGEPLPAAVLCYVWDATLKPGTLLPNAYTARVRYLVLDGAESPRHQWASHSRNLQQDFKLAFGDESPSVPPLIAIVVGADSDNTGGTSLGYIGDISLKP
jgi:hypothetical protein